MSNTVEWAVVRSMVTIGRTNRASRKSSVTVVCRASMTICDGAVQRPRRRILLPTVEIRSGSSASAAP